MWKSVRYAIVPLLLCRLAGFVDPLGFLLIVLSHFHKPGVFSTLLNFMRIATMMRCFGLEVHIL
jgi:hypothetical protein